jgi:ATP-dependent DNA helicase RecG
MQAVELLNRIQRGEDSKTQFKQTINNVAQLAQEFVAFSNSEGGILCIGVAKNGQVSGLTFNEIEKINQHISNAASQHVKSPIAPLTENIAVQGRTVIVVHISKGSNKPYYTNEGIAYVKMGADKRIAPPEEILRLFQSAGKIYADEMVVNGTSSKDINLDYYKIIFNKRFERKGITFDTSGISVETSLQNQQLYKEGNLTVAGLLVFCNNRHHFRPQFSMQCFAIQGTDLIGSPLEDNEPSFEGNLEQVYFQALNFIDRNIKKIPSGSSFNSPLKWQIPKDVFEEVLVNALVHRDYFIDTTIKVFMFTDRVEIISPGKLPNSQTEATIVSGVSIPRNPVLQSLAQYVLPYKGAGTGLMRAVSLYPPIEFVNDQQKERFVVIIKRP